MKKLHLSNRSLYLFYKDLAQEGKIMIDGAAWSRMKHFQNKIQ